MLGYAAEFDANVASQTSPEVELMETILTAHMSVDLNSSQTSPEVELMETGNSWISIRITRGLSDFTRSRINGN